MSITTYTSQVKLENYNIFGYELKGGFFFVFTINVADIFWMYRNDFGAHGIDILRIKLFEGIHSVAEQRDFHFKIARCDRREKNERTKYSQCFGLFS